MEGQHLRSGMSGMFMLGMLVFLLSHTDAWLNIRRCSGSSLPQPDGTYTFKDITKSSYRVGEKVEYICAPGLETQSGSRVAECTAYNGWELKDDLHCAVRTTQKTTSTKKPILTTTTKKPVMPMQTRTTKKPVMTTQETTTKKPIMLATTPSPASQEVQALGTTVRPTYEELMTTGVITTSGSALPGDLDPHGATLEEDGSTVSWPAILGGCGGFVVLLLSLTVAIVCYRKHQQPGEPAENQGADIPLNPSSNPT